MNTRHWVSVAIVLVIGYFLGIYFPAYGNKAVTQISSLVS